MVRSKRQRDGPFGQEGSGIEHLVLRFEGKKALRVGTPSESG